MPFHAAKALTRFSLRTTLLLFTIAAMAFTIWRLNAELSPLRAENRRLRNEVGELAIEDESLFHAIAVRTSEDYFWKWRIWIPKGHSYKLIYQADSASQYGSGESTSAFTISEPGEHWVEYRISRDPVSGKWMDRMLTEQGSVGSSQQDWVDWPDKTSTTDGVGRNTESVPAGQKVVLIRCRVSQGNRVDQNGVPSAGFIIWLEPAP